MISRISTIYKQKIHGTEQKKSISFTHGRINSKLFCSLNRGMRKYNSASSEEMT